MNVNNRNNTLMLMVFGLIAQCFSGVFSSLAPVSELSQQWQSLGQEAFRNWTGQVHGDMAVAYFVSKVNKLKSLKGLSEIDGDHADCLSLYAAFANLRSFSCCFLLTDSSERQALQVVVENAYQNQLSNNLSDVELQITIEAFMSRFAPQPSQEDASLFFRQVGRKVLSSVNKVLTARGSQPLSGQAVEMKTCQNKVFALISDRSSIMESVPKYQEIVTLIKEFLSANVGKPSTIGELFPFLDQYIKDHFRADVSQKWTELTEQAFANYGGKEIIFSFPLENLKLIFASRMSQG